MWMMLCFCAELAATPAQAQDPGVRAALQRYAELEYQAAVPLLERALARTDLSQPDRRIALAYLGRAHAVLHQQPAAVDAFAALLELEPEYAIPAIESPLIRDAFGQAQLRVTSARAARSPVASAETTSESHAASMPAVAPSLPDADPAASRSELRTAERTSFPTTAQPVPADDAAPEDHSGQLIVGAALVAGGGLLGAGALALWLLWPAPEPGTNLGSWELP
ncbi:MAG: hypothetical protein ABIJ09_13205 [Pseudomonadota bacterium]